MAIFPGTAFDDTYGGTTDDDTIDGLGGNDTLGGNAGNDTIRGGSGNDIINGGSGNNLLYGDAGDDTINGGDGYDIIQGGLGRDTLNGGGGEGYDTVDYTTFNGDGIYNLVAGTANLGVFTETILNFESIFAGTGNDIITLPAYASNNFLPNGFSSVPQTFAGGGNDLVNGGASDDTIYGGDGNDTLNGNIGDDRLYGEAGDDIINGGAGDDNIYGGLGQDTLDGGDGRDVVNYTTFNGIGIYNLTTETAILTGAFTEQIKNFETIYAGAGNDQITGTSGDNYLNGGAGDDTIYGGAGNDGIDGGAGNDFIQGGLGQDSLGGGDGIDTVDYTTFNGGGTYNLTLGTAVLTGAFTETMINFENINTGAGNDQIVGTAGMNTLDGGAGDDTIYGNAGNDTIAGGTGDDYIQGGLGQDTLDGGTGIDTVDYLSFGGDGTYNLTAGTAILTGAFTETMTNFENINAGAGNDTITGTSGANTLYGNAGNDIINGGAGNDYIRADAGNDTLRGNAGNDDLYGNGGFDGFVFGDTVLSATNTVAGSIGTDKIYDFIQGTDRIVLSGNAFNLTQSTFSANILELSFKVVDNDALAATATAAIVYSKQSRSLSYNPNGTAAGFDYGGTFAILDNLASNAILNLDNFIIA